MSMEQSRGMVHVYSGEGKGKTTAALGLALRAYGAGFKVYFAQFLKKGDFSETESLKILQDRIAFRQFGTGQFLDSTNRSEVESFVLSGFETLEKEVFKREYDLIILDEIIFAIEQQLISQKTIFDFIDKKPVKTELVLTGRGAGKELIEKADLVTIMENRKHYFEKRVKARKGIEF